MNIKQAKEELTNSIRAYLKKDESGAYKIPTIHQRPIFLMGPPGIGKTQIMEQIAAECEIGLVSYTITHHTRQSAVGLPFIKEKQYGEEKYSVTEYTMSEIIASVYEKIQEEGKKEGILFIDEINCVSETLAPTMLQFLQCKQFGNQKVPNGWIIVAAGNPPEYNRSVREFDMVTLDRVRCIEVEADLKVWREYAKKAGVHKALLSYLEIRPEHFYKVETGIDGLSFVTARGWEDLSRLMQVYEELKIPVTEEIIYEFLRHKEIAEDVSAYLDLYHQYEDDYDILEILNGNTRPEIFQRIYKAGFDERISVVNLLLDALCNRLKKEMQMRSTIEEWFKFLKRFTNEVEAKGDPIDCYERLLQEYKGSLQRSTMYILQEHEPKTKDPDMAVDQIRQAFAKRVEELEQVERSGSGALEHAFDFMESAFQEREEMVVFLTELSLAKEIVEHLTLFPCARYNKYHEALLVGSERAKILSKMER